MKTVPFLAVAAALIAVAIAWQWRVIAGSDSERKSECFSEIPDVEPFSLAGKRLVTGWPGEANLNRLNITTSSFFLLSSDFNRMS
jgi:hypothetical protein